MSLAPGTRLGPYELLASIGAGGMGEVYRALDTKLDREVAIKVLPPDFAQDPDRLARFKREAKVLASLNHPNIAQIYGVEDRAIVMELVVGDSPRGPLPLDTALQYARQIAVALEAAHEKGVVHRDLKPANIKVTLDGVVKVLDFGLAAIPPGSSGDSTPATSPTLTMSTRAGVILGTAEYMSPEQACGKPADKRADVWSFGVVLWELLTGHRLFVGETVSDTLADVLRGPIDVDQLPSETPPGIRSLLRRCLDRNVKNRLRDIGEARIAIDAALVGATPPPQDAPESSIARKRWLPWSVAAVASVLAMGLAPFAFLHFRPKPAIPSLPVRFQILAPENATFNGMLSLSPDGRKLAFVAGDRLWVHFLESGESRDITAAQDGPFWSPDSRFIGYPLQSQLKKIEATGGSPQTVSDLHGNWGGGTWSQDDVIVFSDNSGGLFRVPSSGGTPVPITALDPALHETSHWAPYFLPDGRHFFYNRFSYANDSAVYVGSVDDKPEQPHSKPLVASNWGAVYAPSTQDTGYLLLLRHRTLLAQPFDSRRLELTGQAVPVAEQVGDATGLGYGGFSASNTNVLAFSHGSPEDDQLTWSDREGKVLGTIGESGEYEDPALSPDGSGLAVTKPTSETVSNIWLLDLSRGTNTRFTFGSALDSDPVWSPDGGRIIFSSMRKGGRGLYLKLVSGIKDEEILLEPGEARYPTSWSHDGRFLLYQERNVSGKLNIWVLPLEGDRKPVRFLATEFSEGDAHLSPDGRWVAYVSDESSQPQVYVRSFSLRGTTASGEAVKNTDVKFQISNAPGFQPRWRADGRELFYRSIPNGKVMAVEIAADLAFRAGAPRPVGIGQPLFQGWPSPGSRWDSSPDGKRFLTLTSVPTKPKPLTVVLNWQSELKK